MSVRSQLAKLKRQAGGTQFNRDVRDIGCVMDELSALATGGSSIRRAASLIEILDGIPDLHRMGQGPNDQKITQ